MGAQLAIIGLSLSQLASGRVRACIKNIESTLKAISYHICRIKAFNASTPVVLLFSAQGASKRLFDRTERVFLRG